MKATIIITLLTLLLTANSTRADPTRSVSYLLPGCRMFVAGPAQLNRSADDAWRIGMCAGSKITTPRPTNFRG